MSAFDVTPLQDEALNEEVIVLGAGASGLAAAVLLARQGMKVTIYERMQDLDQADEESYPIGVNPRGLEVLRRVDPALEKAIDVTDFGKVAGWCIREPKKEIAKLKSGTVVGTTRGKVVAELYAAALKTPGVDIVLGAKLVSADVAAATMTFSRARAGGGGSGAKEEEEEEEEEELTAKYGQARVLDCTGCFSKLRTAVASHDASFRVETFPWEISFRNLFTDPTPPAVHLDPTLHYIFTTGGIYAAVLTGSRWVFSCSVNPMLTPGCEWMLDDKPTPSNIARLKAHVAQHVPQAVGMLSEAEYERFFTRRAFTGQVVKLERLNYGERVAFLGDSAHAVIPSTGEGINSALEDVTVLLAALGSGSRSGWFGRYNTARVADANAISDYAAYLLAGMKADPAERNRRTASMVLSLIGQSMGLLKPTWNDLSFGRLAPLQTPYSTIHREWERQMRKVEPWGNRIIWYFAKDGGRKQVRAQRKAAKMKERAL